MTGLNVKRQIINDLNILPQKYIMEVYDFIEFLKLREDQWFIDYINQRTKTALQDKRRGKKFHSLSEIQKAYSK